MSASTPEPELCRKAGFVVCLGIHQCASNILSKLAPPGTSRDTFAQSTSTSSQRSTVNTPVWNACPQILAKQSSPAPPRQPLHTMWAGSAMNYRRPNTALSPREDPTICPTLRGYRRPQSPRHPSPFTYIPSVRLSQRIPENTSIETRVAVPNAWHIWTRTEIHLPRCTVSMVSLTDSMVFWLYFDSILVPSEPQFFHCFSIVWLHLFNIVPQFFHCFPIDPSRRCFSTLHSRILLGIIWPSPYSFHRFHCCPIFFHCFMSEFPPFFHCIFPSFPIFFPLFYVIFPHFYSLNFSIAFPSIHLVVAFP